MASASLFPVESKRNYFITKQKKKMVHIDLKSLRYKIWLWLVRECALWKTLTREYERIPSMTLTKAITWLLVRFPIMMRVLSKIETAALKKTWSANFVKTPTRRQLQEQRIIERYLRSRQISNFM